MLKRFRDSEEFRRLYGEAIDVELVTKRPNCYEPRKTYAGQQQRNRALAPKCRKVKSRSMTVVGLVAMEKSRQSKSRS